MSDQPELPELLLSMRVVHEQMLASALGTTDTAGTCFYSCVLLRETVNRFTRFTAHIRGGDGRSSGFQDGSGQLHDHYWVEASDGKDCWVLDITADQFGGPRVTQLALEHSRAHYLPGSQAEVDEHVALFGVVD